MPNALARVVDVRLHVPARELTRTLTAALERNVDKLRAGIFLDQARERLVRILRQSAGHLERTAGSFGCCRERLVVIVWGVTLGPENELVEHHRGDGHEVRMLERYFGNHGQCVKIGGAECELVTVPLC